MENTEHLKKRIKTFIEKKLDGNSQKLATVAGLHRNSLRDWKSKDWNPESKTLDKCLEAVKSITAARQEQESVLKGLHGA